MKNRLGWLPVIAVAGLIVLLFVSGPGSRWLARHLTGSHDTHFEVGHLFELSGAAKIIRSGQVDSLKGPLASAIALRDGDRLEVSAGSKAAVALNSHDEFDVNPLSALQFQLWDPHDHNSPIYVNVMKGDLQLRKRGLRRRAYVVRDGKLYLPGQKALARALALTVLKSAPLDMELAPPEDETDNSGSMTASAAPPVKISESGPETLSNAYISSTIEGQKGELQRCWISHLRESPEDAKGRLELQFEISNAGGARNVRIASSTFKDQTLQNCVVSVFQRLTFMPYSGAVIALTYPIHFE